MLAQEAAFREMVPPKPAEIFDPLTAREMEILRLIGRGYSSGQAMALIAGMRPVADPYIWYIRRRIEQFEARWQRITRRQS